MAHITMLESIGLLTAGELEMLLAELKNIYASAEKGEFVIEDGIEAGQAKLKVTIRAEVNMFMKAMVAKPLQDGVDKLAEMLSMIPY